MQELLNSKEDRYKAAAEAELYIINHNANDTEFVQLALAASGQLELAVKAQAKVLMVQRDGDDLRKQLVCNHCCIHSYI